MRLLFASIHCYSPSSGAALCTRELLELLVGRDGLPVLTTGIIDPERETSLDEVLATLELPVRRFQAELERQSGRGDRPDINGVRVTLMTTAFSLAEGSPDRGVGDLPGLGRAGLRPVRPEVLLTYGGHPASSIYARAEMSIDIDNR